MVVQIIRSGETARKMEAARTMMLVWWGEAVRSSGQVSAVFNDNHGIYVGPGRTVP
jgi:hypothetical protein